MAEFFAGPSIESLIGDLQRLAGAVKALPSGLAAVPGPPVAPELRAITSEVQKIMALRSEMGMPTFKMPGIPTAPELPKFRFPPGVPELVREPLRAMWPEISKMPFEKPEEALFRVPQIAALFPPAAAPEKYTPARALFALMEETAKLKAGLEKPLAEVISFPELPAKASKQVQTAFEAVTEAVQRLDPRALKTAVSQLIEAAVETPTFEVGAWLTKYHKVFLEKLPTQVWAASIRTNAQKMLDLESASEAERAEKITAISQALGVEHIEDIKALKDREAAVVERAGELRKNLEARITEAAHEEDVKQVQLKAIFLALLTQELQRQNEAYKNAVLLRAAAEEEAAEKIRATQEKIRRDIRQMAIEKIPLLGGMLGPIFRPSETFGAGGFTAQAKELGVVVPRWQQQIFGMREALDRFGETAGSAGGKVGQFLRTLGSIAAGGIGGILGNIGGAFGAAAGPIGGILGGLTKVASAAWDISTGIVKFGFSLMTLPFTIIQRLHSAFQSLLFTVFLIQRTFRTLFAEPAEIMRTVQVGTMAASGSLKDFGENLDLIIDLSVRFARPMGEIAEGFTEIAKAGYNVTESQEILQGALLYSVLFQEKLSEATQSVVSILKTFDMKASETSKVVGMLRQAQQMSLFTTSELKISLGYAASAAASFNISLQEMLGMLVLFRNAGLLASRAGETFRTGLSNIERAALAATGETMNMEKATELLAEQGVNWDRIREAFESEDPEIQMRALRITLEELHKVTEDGIDSMERLALRQIFGARHAAYWTARIKAGGEALDAAVKQIEAAGEGLKAQEDLMKDAEEMSATFAATLIRLQNIWIALRTSFLRGIGAPFAGIEKPLERIAKFAIEVGDRIGAFFRVAIIDPLVKRILGPEGIKKLESPSVIEGLVRLGERIGYQLVRIIDAVWNALSKIFGPETFEGAEASIELIGDLIVGSIYASAELITVFFAFLHQKVEGIGQTIGKVFAFLTENFPRIFLAALNTAVGILDAVITIGVSLATNLKIIGSILLALGATGIVVGTLSGNLLLVAEGFKAAAVGGAALYAGIKFSVETEKLGKAWEGLKREGIDPSRKSLEKFIEDMEVAKKKAVELKGPLAEPAKLPTFEEFSKLYRARIEEAGRERKAEKAKKAEEGLEKVGSAAEDATEKLVSFGRRLEKTGDIGERMASSLA
jgi:TP901 family phage tail tape measure protein